MRTPKAMRNAAKRYKNTLISGSGAATTSDRGAMQTAAPLSLSPYYTFNYLQRYQQYVNLYETSWEARKIIDIPVEDAMRSPTIREGISSDDAKLLDDKWQELGCERQLRRCLKQERLLGGCVLLGIMRLQDGEKLDEPLNEKNIEIDDLEALNVVDVSRLSRADLCNDPFKPDYDKVSHLMIDGVTVHQSRMVVFNGDTLFGRNSQRLLQSNRHNPLGFGDSKLTPIWDILTRSIGTQQGAYHLVNMASALVMSVDNLRSIKAVDNHAEEKLKEVVQQLSIYNAALVDGKDVRIDTKSTAFGSVPELVLTFTQFLAAASDIPVTRFLGTSAQGLSATGEGDARNYYDMVDSIRNNVRKPAELRILNWIGSSIFGHDNWNARSKDLQLSFEPLWNMDAVQAATRDEIITRTVTSLYQAQIISAETAVAELNKREIFETPLEAEAPTMESGLLDIGNPFDDSQSIDKATQKVL